MSLPPRSVSVGGTGRSSAPLTGSKPFLRAEPEPWKGFPWHWPWVVDALLSLSRRKTLEALRFLRGSRLPQSLARHYVREEEKGLGNG